MVFGIPLLWPLLALTHNTNNSSTPCDQSPVAQSASIVSCISMKKSQLKAQKVRVESNLQWLHL